MALSKVPVHDFAGWATVHGIRCSDGRTICRGAFDECNGTTVPIFWNHNHNDVEDCLGHAVLESREQGIYAYGKFNSTPSGVNARNLVMDGDITSLSIFANQLTQNGGDVLHGIIREVSLVPAGANPGAKIESVIRHGAECMEEATIYSGHEGLQLAHSDMSDGYDTLDYENAYEPIPEPSMGQNEGLSVNEYLVSDLHDDTPIGLDDLAHSADSEETVEDIINTMNEKQKNVLYGLLSAALNGEGVSHSAMELDENATIEEIVDSMNPQQQAVLEALIDAASESGDGNDYEEDGEMAHNVFENNHDESTTLSHADMAAEINGALADIKRYGSAKEAFLQHGITGITGVKTTMAHSDETRQTYGIKDIDQLFPNYKDLYTPPMMINNPAEWVGEVMGSVGHIPFTRVKTMFADIREDEARAKGYIKGKLKKEEVFSLLKRTTDPQTIYKKQKLDRDDIIDISWDVVTWLKQEMRVKLDEEIARAVLIGDGRLSSDDDHINPTHVRPVWTDSDLFTVKAPIALASNATADDRARAFIRAVIKQRKNYKGTGTPTLYTSEDMLTDMLLLEDTTGRRIYKDVAELTSVLRVKKIVTVFPFGDAKSVTREGTGEDAGKNFTLLGLVVNLADYKIGTDPKGGVSFFDDFDIDYNAQKYLIETRISGALTVPFAAIAIEETAAA